MPTPFPGMDPYLERPSSWADVHVSLIAAIRDALVPLVVPRYYVALEERVYSEGPADLELVGVPDAAVARSANPPERPGGGGVAVAEEVGVEVVEVDMPMADPAGVREWFLEIRATATKRVVTVLEILSPANKRPGRGRRLYERKRRRVLESRTSLVEVDLLRGGLPMATLGPKVASDYRIVVSRGDRRPRASLYPFGVRRPIPRIPVPLLPGEDEPELDLNAVLHALYDRARFDLRLDYAAPADPPLNDADAAWARELPGLRR